MSRARMSEHRRGAHREERETTGSEERGRIYDEFGGRMWERRVPKRLRLVSRLPYPQPSHSLPSPIPPNHPNAHSHIVRPPPLHKVIDSQYRQNKPGCAPPHRAFPLMSSPCTTSLPHLHALIDNALPVFPTCSCVFLAVPTFPLRFRFTRWQLNGLVRKSAFSHNKQG